LTNIITTGDILLSRVNLLIIVSIIDFSTIIFLLIGRATITIIIILISIIIVVVVIIISQPLDINVNTSTGLNVTNIIEFR
ncbi:hypothetical protein OFB65_26775, partial [Escherichia coli]|nr:hypothetical protein [Escherichia coli]